MNFFDKIYQLYYKPKIFFPAGGTYSIYGKFHKLNKYIAQPNFSEIKAKISSLKTNTYNLIGEGSVCFNNKNYNVSKKLKKINNVFDKKFINQIKNLNYYYSE